MPLSWLALLFVILAVAVTALDEDHSLLRDLGRESSAAANIKKLAARYRSHAMQCLAADQFLYQHNLQTFQTLVLLIYAMNHANISSWALLGTTWNIATRIGCHIDPSRLNLSVIEGEERRRCWAALMMLYTMQNSCLNNIASPIIIADVELPADKDDDELEDSLLINDRWKPSKMSYILYKFRLYKVAAEICQHALNEELHDPRTIVSMDEKLAKEEQEHTLRFSSQSLPLYHIVHHYILQIYTHYLYLILHKKSLKHRRAGDDAVLQSRQRCRVSAKTILEIHACLYDTPEFQPYQWYLYGIGSFHAFLAVSVMITLLSTTREIDDDSPHLLALVEQCVQRFEIMSNRSDICSKAVVILRHLLRTTSQPAATQYNDGINVTSFLPRNTSHCYPISSTTEPEDYITNTYNWVSNQELESLLFDTSPQQWMFPSSSIWDQVGFIAVT